MNKQKSSLGNYVKVEGGYAFKSSEFVKEGVPIIRISNFNRGMVDLKKCVKYPVKILRRGM